MDDERPGQRRGYDATARRARAEHDRGRTRQRVLDAAEDLFTTEGYAATSMADVAAAAGVSVQTIYLAVGPKADVLRAVAARAVLGADVAGTVPQLPWVAQLAAEEDPHRQLAIMVHELIALAERSVPVWRVLEQAAAADPALAAEVAENEAGRLRDQQALVGLLRGLRVPRERATDVVHAVLRPAVWQVFVVERGWSREDVEELVLDVLTHLLL